MMKTQMVLNKARNKKVTVVIAIALIESQWHTSGAAGFDQ
jgi:hypothetical protein